MSRERDHVWDALVDMCKADSSQMTKSERGRFNKAVKELKEVSATPEDIRARAGRWRNKYPQLDLTPTALVAQWSTLRPPSSRPRVEKNPFGEGTITHTDNAEVWSLPEVACRHGVTGRCMDCAKEARAGLGGLSREDMPEVQHEEAVHEQAGSAERSEEGTPENA